MQQAQPGKAGRRNWESLKQAWEPRNQDTCVLALSGQTYYVSYFSTGVIKHEDQGYS